MPKLGGLPGSPVAPTASPSLSLNGTANPAPSAANSTDTGSMFNKFSDFVDTEKGTLRFAGKAVIHGQGIDFSSGNNFSISLDEVDTLEELGKGNYGTVYKVRHARPRQQRMGLGLQVRSSAPNASHGDNGDGDSPLTKNSSGVIMAMKEIRLELDEAKFAAIIMELDILHRCVSPYIIDFYGAFFQEGAVRRARGRAAQDHLCDDERAQGAQGRTQHYPPRREADEHPGQYARPGEDLRFRRQREPGGEYCEDEYRVSELYGARADFGGWSGAGWGGAE
ncbi:hypothetical protein V492_00786 [Pseudogymnoascus sp. VKM F-4246]|nr:hypothetical protein V492_00786 [Pseudogymnoascus sp. VKM F-4246]